MLQDILIGIVSGLLIIAGGIGSVLPILPGTPLSFLGLWLFAWQTGYQTITPTVLVVFGILTLLTMIVDFVSPALGAKGYKSSRYGALGSMAGAFLGIFILGPLGLILGPFIGGFLGEYFYVKNIEHAKRVAWGAFVGFLIGSLFKIAVVVAMLAYFIYALF